MHFYRKLFTLIELIVVIAIVIVLAAAAFLVFSNWIANSRDTRKRSDISQITKSFEIYKIENILYPEPDNYKTVKDSSGVIAWYQGNFGDTVSKKLKTYSNAPKDPSDSYYEYSITADKKKYQVKAILENSTGMSLRNAVYAATVLLVGLPILHHQLFLIKMY